jgi:hypothetical protein
MTRPSIMAQVAESMRMGRESAARNKATDIVASPVRREPSVRAYRVAAS